MASKAARTYVVSGSASGIRRATKELIESEGHRVIGVDIRNAEIIADLGLGQGGPALIEQSDDKKRGVVDAVLAIAGIDGDGPATPPRPTSSSWTNWDICPPIDARPTCSTISSAAGTSSARSSSPPISPSSSGAPSFRALPASSRSSTASPSTATSFDIDADSWRQKASLRKPKR
jgi:hypothetical protein